MGVDGGGRESAYSSKLLSSYTLLIGITTSFIYRRTSKFPDIELEKSENVTVSSAGINCYLVVKDARGGGGYRACSLITRHCGACALNYR